MIYPLEYLFLVSMILVAQVSAYTSASYGGYLFTTPDNTDDNKRSKTDAVVWCQNNGTKLLEIPSNDLQTTLVQYIQILYNKGGFNGWTTVINARRYNQNWDWVNGQDINNLAVEQQSPDLTKSFGFLQSTGSRILVAAGVATDVKPYICEGSSYCTAGVTFQQRCYRTYSETMTWFDARNRCLDGGGDLASFDFVMNSQALSVLNGTWLSPTISYWIGIRRSLWKWDGTNSEVKYTQWVDGHPDFSLNYECICLYSGNWRWIMCDCGTRYQFICLTVAPSSTTTKTTTTSTSTTTTKPTTTTTTTTTTTPPSVMTRPTTASTVKGFVTVNNFSTTKSSFTSSSVAANPGSVPAGSGRSSALTYSAALGIGLGVGIGGGLIISAIIVVVYVLARRRGWTGTFPVLKKSESSDDSHQPTGSSYALISRKMQHQTSGVDTNIDSGTSNIVYSDLQHFSSSAPAETSSMEKFSSTPTNSSPDDSTIGEIINGGIETVA